MGRVHPPRPTIGPATPQPAPDPSSEGSRAAQDENTDGCNADGHQIAGCSRNRTGNDRCEGSPSNRVGRSRTRNGAPNDSGSQPRRREERRHEQPDDDRCCRGGRCPVRGRQVRSERLGCPDCQQAKGQPEREGKDGNRQNPMARQAWSRRFQRRTNERKAPLAEHRDRYRGLGAQSTQSEGATGRVGGWWPPRVRV